MTRFTALFFFHLSQGLIGWEEAGTSFNYVEPLLLLSLYQPLNRDWSHQNFILRQKNGDKGIGGRQKRAGQVILFLFVISILFVISFVGVILIVFVISIVFVIQLCSSKKFCDQYLLFCLILSLSLYLKVHEPSSAGTKGPVHVCLDR